MRGSAHRARVFFRRSDFRHWRFWYDHRWVLSSGGGDPLFGHCTLTGCTGPLVGLWFAMLGHRLRCCVQIHRAPKIVGPPWKIKLLHSFFKLAEQRAPSFDFPLIVSKFSKCPPSSPLPVGTIEGLISVHVAARARFYSWRNKAGDIAGRLRQTTRRGLEGTVSGQRAAGLAAWVARPGA